jgi:hypothetical protein
MKCEVPPNSFVQMTPTAFMTNEAFDEIAEPLAKGIRAMPVIKHYPDFWVVLHFDGCKSHIMTHHAQKMFYNHNIICVKENSHSSQINEAFDKDPAKKSKAEDKRWQAATGARNSWYGEGCRPVDPTKCRDGRSVWRKE